MEALLEYLFVLILAAGVWSWISGKKLLGVGLIALGVGQPLWWVADHWFGHEGLVFMRSVSRPLHLSGWVLLVVGLVQTIRGRHTGALARGGATMTVGLPAEAARSLVVPRNDTNSYTAAVVKRDDLYERFRTVWQRSGATVIGYKSAVQEGTVWLRFDCVAQAMQSDLTLRASVTVEIERFDFHRFPLLLKVELRDTQRLRTYSGVIDLDVTDMGAIVAYLTAPTTRRAPRLRKIRQWALQLWRPHNKVLRLRQDWGWGPLLGGLALALALIPYIGPILTVAVWIALIVRSSRRRLFSLTSGRPSGEPRQLRRLDSWQTNLYGLGARAADVRAAVLARLSSAAENRIAVSTELIWYPTADGKVERQQIVVGFRRALGFVQVEACGDDLYVGWDSHVNGGTWVEQPLAVGTDRQTGQRVVANGIVPGQHQINEYDLGDANYLTEWLHSIVSRVIRLKFAELRIDQEIDFTIQRESRRTLLEPAAASVSEGMPRQTWRRALRRLG